MALNGIDISSYQTGINLTAVPCDFVIVKATQGTNYINPDCVRAVEQAMSAGKAVGTYHYISGGDAVAEANFYIDSILNWVGKTMICLDWESNQNSAWGNEGYLETMIIQILSRTGVPPMLYVQQSRYTPVANLAKKYKCGLWIAQYASMNATGYQTTPWNEGSYTCAIRQYSSAGRLNGWNGNLDLNKFYGSKDDWIRYCNPSSSTSGGETIMALEERDINAIWGYCAPGKNGESKNKQPFGNPYETLKRMMYLQPRVLKAKDADDAWFFFPASGKIARCSKEEYDEVVMDLKNMGYPDVYETTFHDAEQRQFFADSLN